MEKLEERIQKTKQNYSNQKGPEKLKKVEGKIYASKKIRRLIQQSQQKMLSPNKNDFLYSVNEIPFFILSKKDTIFMGVVCAFELWHKTINTSYQYMDEFSLNRTFEEILNDFKK
ncbi:MAG: hypothetical protein ACOCQ4_01825 [bacterium]